MGKPPTNWELVSAPVVAGATLNQHQTRRFVRALNDGCKPYPTVPPPTPHRLTTNSWLSPATSQISQDGDNGESYRKTTSRLVESISSILLRTTIPYISNNFPTDEGWPVLSEPFGANTTSLRERKAASRVPPSNMAVLHGADFHGLRSSSHQCLCTMVSAATLIGSRRAIGNTSKPPAEPILIRMNRNTLPLIKRMLID